MSPNATQGAILIVDDDADDRLMIEDAFHDCGIGSALRFAVDGEELMDYLHRRPGFNDTARHPPPCLILLDLNMPRKDGREALAEIKSDPMFRQTPVVVLTTSKSPDDIARCYQMGANSYITKPGDYAALLDLVRGLARYWLQLVQLPRA
jgi:CheY-like chemotaxis protein